MAKKRAPAPAPAPVKEYYQPDLSTFHEWMKDAALASRAFRSAVSLPARPAPIKKGKRK